MEQTYQTVEECLEEEEGLFLLLPKLTEVKASDEQKNWWKVACKPVREILQSQRKKEMEAALVKAGASRGTPAQAIS